MSTAGLIVGGFGAAVIFGLLISQPLLKHIRQQKEAVKRAPEEDCAPPVDTSVTRDEIADLTVAFNEMARDLKVSAASIDDLNREIRKRRRAEAALRKSYDELELRVKQRTIELEKTKLKAERANKAKSAFLANMSHELRTPLNHMIGFTELVAYEQFGKLSAIQKEYLLDALDSSRHLLSLINDILDISKVEAGRIKVQPEEICLRTTLEKSLAQVEPEAQDSGLNLTTRIGSIPETLIADKQKIMQILHNLLSNAVKFTPSGGTVCLTAELVDIDIQAPPVTPLGGHPPLDPAHKQWVTITISDSGIGIDPLHLEAVFIPFEQVENSTSRKFQGTGLGLPICRSFVELHNGHIWADSEGAGKGARFTVALPIIEREELELENPPEASKGEAGKRADDQEPPGTNPQISESEVPKLDHGSPDACPERASAPDRTGPVTNSSSEVTAITGRPFFNGTVLKDGEENRTTEKEA